MIKLYFYFLLILLFFSLCGKYPQSVSEIFINNKSIESSDKYILVYNEKLYTSAYFLQKHLDLEVKELVKGEQLGVCMDELCIPFSLGENEGDAVVILKEYYFPVDILFNAFRWKYEWEKEENVLKLNIPGIKSDY